MVLLGALPLTRALPWYRGGVLSFAARRASAPACALEPSQDDAWSLTAGWREALSEELSNPSFAQLQEFVEAERERANVLPSREDQFAAFAACDFDNVRVVILGQDPYPTPGHAHGLSFSVLPHVRPLPGSLRNIYKELYDDLAIPPPPHGCLSAWSDQGVLLLNSVLSVRAGEAGSHAKMGWERLTGYSRDEVVGRPLKVLQGAQTEPEMVALLMRSVQEQRPVSVRITNYTKQVGGPAPVAAPVSAHAREQPRAAASHASRAALLARAHSLLPTPRRA